MNDQRNQGVKLNDPRHPVVQLESWSKPQTVRGVVKGSEAKLLGAVVLRGSFLELGKKGKAQPIMCRLKITSSKSTDWTPIIFGARAIE